MYAIAQSKAMIIPIFANLNMNGGTPTLVPSMSMVDPINLNGVVSNLNELEIPVNNELSASAELGR